MPALTQRQELFCQGVFEGKSATQAYKDAGYSHSNATSAAARLCAKVGIKARIKELNDMALTSKVMSVSERKERLSEIARARLTDFVSAGADGSWINVGPESTNSAAIQGVKSSTEYDKDGTKPTVITDLKLHDPVKAIAELNKMDGAYSPAQVQGEILLRVVEDE